MFKHILVPLDGSELSESALPVAEYLSHIMKAPVTLLHVIEQDAPDEVHQERHLTEPSAAKAYLADIARNNFSPDIKVDWHVHSAAISDVSRSIVDHSSDELQPDLIILTSHGNSGTRDLFFGNIAQQVAAGSGIPVMIIKPREIPFQFALSHILVPLDNESVHDKALPIAKDLAVACEAKLELICVIPTLSTLSGEQAASGNLMPSTTTAYLDIAEEIAREHFRVHLDEFSNAGLPASAQIARGDPILTIAKSAEMNGSDLVIFGTHGRSGLDAFWNRSVAAGVARRIQIPVLLIPLEE
jgi:nucleotide-binding universal stress UspA family protein